MRLILYLGADFFVLFGVGGSSCECCHCQCTQLLGENYYPCVRARNPFIWGKEIENKLKLMVTLFFKNPPSVPQ